MANNPFATQKVGDSITDTPQYSMPNGNYAAPDVSEGAPYITALGWSPSLARRGSTTETPSAQRLGTIPLIQRYPQANRPPEEYYGRNTQDIDTRESVTETVAFGQTELKDNYTRADNPYVTPRPETRPTQQLNPHQYTFTRPFNQTNARLLNGVHFSMADHRRNYEIGGMNPVPVRRNTYRTEPTPWDTNIVDMPPASEVVFAQQTSPVAPYRGGTYRLGA